MKKIKHVLSEEEKGIIENHFLYNKTDSRQNYLQFCTNMIKHYTDFQEVKSLKTNNEYSIELIWDEESNTTAMMHCFAHKKFRFSNSKWKAFRFFNSDINAQNNLGQTALMLLNLSVNGPFSVRTLAKEEGMDLSIFDKNGNSFHMYVMKGFKFEVFDPKKIKDDMRFDLEIFTKLEIFEDVLFHWLELSGEKKNEQVTYVIQKGEEVINYLKDLKEYAGLFKSYNTAVLKEHIDKSIRPMESAIQMLALNNKLDSKVGIKTRSKI